MCYGLLDLTFPWLSDYFVIFGCVLLVEGRPASTLGSAGERPGIYVWETIGGTSGGDTQVRAARERPGGLRWWAS